MRALKYLGLLVAALAVSALGASPAMAANPGGDACNTTDGKINGRGATFQRKAQELAFIQGYREDICGPGAVPLSTPPALSDYMQWYNYPSTDWTGSTQGIRAVGCRTDAYGGSDVPYTLAQLNQLKGVKGAIGGCPPDPGTPTPPAEFNPPYQPQGNPFTPGGPPHERWPAPGKDNVNPLTIPVALGAMGLGYRLSGAACPGQPGGGAAPPSVINLTRDHVSGLLGGDIHNWNDPRLREGPAGPNTINPILQYCNVTVKRVVRFDGSGTTTQMKLYLFNQGNPDGARIAGATCQPGTAWSVNQNNVWPYDGSFVPNPGPPADGDDGAATANCSQISRRNGTPGVRDRCKTLNGAFCYMDIADLVSADATGLRQSTVRNAADTAFLAATAKNPNTGLSTQSNCDAAKTNKLPGTQPDGVTVTPDHAVGLHPTETWAQDNPSGNYGDATFKGTKYAICAFTWMIFYSGLSGDGPPYSAGETAIDQLSQNQRQNLYTFSQYAVSIQGQARLRKEYYAPIPLTWMEKLTIGIQNNF